MNQHLQQFAQQLATWTKAIIEHGRTPFRRVDTYPYIDTEQGVMQPPLVFWINRQSMMAGGILLLPENNLEEELERGRHCASALGLSHFVTWETDRVRIWEVKNNRSDERQSFPLSSPKHPETFRYLLTDILETLKLLAVIGAIPATDLSPSYFNNLFQITLQQALPPLVKAYRRQRSEADDHFPEDADTCANEANQLLLLQVLALLWFNKFPDAILPEKMERAIELSLLELPDAVRPPLSLKTTIKPPPLPLETAVCFNHLLLRLRQLSWNHPEERAELTIHQLAKYWYRGKTEEVESAEICLYPATPPLDSTTKVLLSESPSFLAITALLTDISNFPQGQLFFGDLFQFDRDTLSSQSIFGRLSNDSGITMSKRREYTARLRISWPNRHLKIKSGQPFWFWELIHLLGLCRPGQNLCLELPVDLLKKSKNKLAWTLLCENFSFQQLNLLDDRVIKLSVLRGGKTTQPFPLQLPDEVRTIVPIPDSTYFGRQILLALTVSTDIYKLLGNELIWSTDERISDEHISGWELYCQSRLYKCLQNILQEEKAQLDLKDKAPENITITDIPFPELLLLKELANFGQVTPPDIQLATIDHYLAKLLTCPAVENIEHQDNSKVQKTGTGETRSEKKFKESIAQQLSAHGIPSFPEQYLYFLDQPKMCHYSIAPPLTAKSSLLGQFELEDAQGQIISGYGEELEQTLLLCSQSDKREIDIPENRHQLEQLLQHYRKDLKDLHNFLNNLCYSQLENSKSARKLARTTWKKLNLPTPSWFMD
ncbi:MAG: hypothetical protein KAG12_10390 [Desulfuromusa sp.]|nr:hypothetical protein [Desulfuromusa sp.]